MIWPEDFFSLFFSLCQVIQAKRFPFSSRLILGLFGWLTFAVWEKYSSSNDLHTHFQVIFYYLNVSHLWVYNLKEEKWYIDRNSRKLLFIKVFYMSANASFLRLIKLTHCEFVTLYYVNVQVGKGQYWYAKKSWYFIYCQVIKLRQLSFCLKHFFDLFL